jgi:hypothetical protein
VRARRKRELKDKEKATAPAARPGGPDTTPKAETTPALEVRR